MQFARAGAYSLVVGSRVRDLSQLQPPLPYALLFSSHD